MIGIRNWLTVRSRHTRPEVLSRYLDGDLTQQERTAVEVHLDDCPDCRGLLESLRNAVQALRSMGANAKLGLADSVIATLRAQGYSRKEVPSPSPGHSGSRALTVVPDLGPDAIEPASAHSRLRSAWRRVPRAVLDYCLRRPQLRLTLPLGLSVGIALSLINKGYMIFNGRIDVEMCAVCALDFVIPFVALNVGLLLAARVAGRRRG
jgi:anti-sigma factor RsiW